MIRIVRSGRHANLTGLIQVRGSRGRAVATRDHMLPLDDFEQASSLGSHLASLHGRSVIDFVRDMVVLGPL